MSLIKHLVNKSIKRSNPANILLCLYDGLFDLELSQTGHNFYALENTFVKQKTAIKNWSSSYLNIIDSANINDYIYDLVIFNDRYKHNELISQLPKKYHIPAIIIDHIVESNNKFLTNRLVQSNNYRSVSCDDTITSIYNNEDTITYFPKTWKKIEKDIDILIIGNFIHQDYNTIRNIFKHFADKHIVLLSNDENLQSTQADDYNDYRNIINRSKIYLNLSTDISITCEMMMAIEAKCAIVSTKTDPITNLLTKGVDVLFINSINDIVNKLQYIMSNPKIYDKLTQHSKFTNNPQYNNDTFLSKWNNIIDQYLNMEYLQ